MGAHPGVAGLEDAAPAACARGVEPDLSVLWGADATSGKIAATAVETTLKKNGKKMETMTWQKKKNRRTENGRPC